LDTRKIGSADLIGLHKAKLNFSISAKFLPPPQQFTLLTPTPTQAAQFSLHRRAIAQNRLLFNNKPKKMSLNTSLRRVSSTGPSTLSSSLSRTSINTPTSTSTTTYICNQCRHATLLRRPKRPYTFTQLITLSDGSTYLHRTTSPIPVYRSTRDTRNSLLWNPTSQKLVNLEEDEAGRLAAFRARFGRAYDANAGASKETEEVEKKETTDGKDQQQQKKQPTEAEKEAAAKAQAEAEAEMQAEEDNLLDLISSFGQEQQNQGKKK
jgi:hypothetical protein